MFTQQYTATQHRPAWIPICCLQIVEQAFSEKELDGTHGKSFWQQCCVAAVLDGKGPVCLAMCCSGSKKMLPSQDPMLHTSCTSQHGSTGILERSWLSLGCSVCHPEDQRLVGCLRKPAWPCAHAMQCPPRNQQCTQTAHTTLTLPCNLSIRFFLLPCCCLRSRHAR